MQEIFEFGQYFNLKNSNNTILFADMLGY